MFYTAAGAPSGSRRLDKAGDVRYSDNINCKEAAAPAFSRKVRRCKEAEMEQIYDMIVIGGGPVTILYDTRRLF